MYDAIIIRKIRIFKKSIKKYCFRKLLFLFGLNIVYNDKGRFERYLVRDKLNVLIIDESPEYAEGLGWFENDFLFDVEVSFRDPSVSRAPRHVLLDLEYSVVSRFRETSELNQSGVVSDSEKSFKIGMVVSDKIFLPGHRLRHSIKDYCKKKYPHKFLTNIRTVSSVFEIYQRCEVAIVVENSFDGSYVSEKFFDAVLSGASVIYVGNYFEWFDLLDTRVFRHLDGKNFSYADLDTAIDQLLASPEKKVGVDANRRYIKDFQDNKFRSVLSSLVVLGWFGQDFGCVKRHYFDQFL